MISYRIERNEPQSLNFSHLSKSGRPLGPVYLSIWRFLYHVKLKLGRKAKSGVVNGLNSRVMQFSSGRTIKYFRILSMGIATLQRL